MEFRFNVNQLFKGPIIKVRNTLLPEGFVGDRRTVSDAQNKLTEIVNEMGEASARAQGLTKPVTTAQKLRNSDHTIYLLAEEGGKNGVVTGLLKVGTKSLYVFDANGDTHNVNALCVLDFYVHESRQRTGHGKQLFHTMLHNESFSPEKLAVDRPSEKLVGFLRKHYGLAHTIPQMNNFVVYEGFFPKRMNDMATATTNGDNRKTHSITGGLYGPNLSGDDYRRRSHNVQSMGVAASSPAAATFASPVGRYAAPRPLCSMAEIIHNSPTATVAAEPSRHSDRMTKRVAIEYNCGAPCLSRCGGQHFGADAEPDDEDEEEHNTHAITSAHTLDNEEDQLSSPPIVLHDEIAIDALADETMTMAITTEHNVAVDICDSDNHLSTIQLPNVAKLSLPLKQFGNGVDIMPLNGQPKSNHFYHTKQHTGLKNLSFNVGMAVSPTNKMEFDQEAPESFGIVKINRPAAGYTSNKLSPDVMGRSYAVTQATAAAAAATDPHFSPVVAEVGSLTDQGYHDLKFFHSKLW